MQRLEGLLRKAVQDYEMIAPATGYALVFPAGRTALR